MITFTSKRPGVGAELESIGVMLTWGGGGLHGLGKSVPNKVCGGADRC